MGRRYLSPGANSGMRKSSLPILFTHHEVAGFTGGRAREDDFEQTATAAKFSLVQHTGVLQLALVQLDG